MVGNPGAKKNVAVAIAKHSSSMSLTQRLSAYLAMVAFGLPSVMIALVGGEAWPFLDYRMYAEPKLSPEVDWLDLVGRTEDGAVWSLNDERYIVPFGLSEVRLALYSLDVFGEVDPAPARHALEGLLVAYEAQRRAGEHDGPRLLSLEVHRVRWTARPGADNYARPDSRTLLQSVLLPKARE
ncbi:hypothetical protein NKDENANG_00886 [Candidatus Entotheonellaceae bacterium PAL068K]